MFYDLDDFKDLNEYFIKLGWLYDSKYSSSNNEIQHLYKKNDDYIKILCNKNNINVSVPIVIGNYKANYNTKFKSIFMAIQYVYNHLNYYEKKHKNSLLEETT